MKSILHPPLIIGDSEYGLCLVKASRWCAISARGLSNATRAALRDTVKIIGETHELIRRSDALLGEMATLGLRRPAGEQDRDRN